MSRADADLRALTFNIHHGEGMDGKVELDRVAAVIADSGAQVVALQEVDRHFGPRSGFADQTWTLGRSRGMTALFGAGVRRPAPAPGRPEAEYGVALLSSLPVTGWCRVPLPSLPGHEPRAMLWADLEVAAAGSARRGVRVGCVHLSVESAEARLAQARLITDMLDDVPVVLLGDLNALPGSDELGVLSQRLQDCWVRVGDGPGATYPADRPKRRIDYVFASPGLTATRAIVVPVAAVSDHRAVVVDVNLSGVLSGVR